MVFHFNFPFAPNRKFCESWVGPIVCGSSVWEGKLRDEARPSKTLAATAHSVVEGTVELYTVFTCFGPTRCES